MKPKIKIILGVLLIIISGIVAFKVVSLIGTVEGIIQEKGQEVSVILKEGQKTVQTLDTKIQQVDPLLENLNKASNQFPEKMEEILNAVKFLINTVAVFIICALILKVCYFALAANNARVLHRIYHRLQPQQNI